MALIPARLPLLVYAGAAGAGFLAARLGSRAAAPATAAPATAAPADGSLAQDTSSLWGGFGGDSSGLGNSQSIGVPPPPYMGPGVGDYLNNPPIGSGGGVSGDPYGPPIIDPTPTPIPTPTVAYWTRPPTAPPAGAVGWTITTTRTWYWPGSSPSALGGGAYFTSLQARYVSGAANGQTPSGPRTVMRVSHSGSIANTWADQWIPTGNAVYPLSAARVPQ